MLLSLLVGVRITRSGITKVQFGSSAEGVQIGRRGGEGIRRPKSGRPKGSARSRSDGMDTVETGVGARDALGAAAKGSRGRETRGGGSTREEDICGTLPGPKP